MDVGEEGRTLRWPRQGRRRNQRRIDWKKTKTRRKRWNTGIMRALAPEVRVTVGAARVLSIVGRRGVILSFLEDFLALQSDSLLFSLSL